MVVAKRGSSLILQKFHLECNTPNFDKIIGYKVPFEGLRKYPFRKGQLISCRAYKAAYQAISTREAVLHLKTNALVKLN